MTSQHPVAAVPERLFDDDEWERRWRARFTATRMSRPDWARDAPDRSVYTSNASGTTEVYAWDRATGLHRQVTSRCSGTHSAELPPDGSTLWWFDDTDGDEFGRWVAEPFGGLPTGARPNAAVPGVEDGYPAGLEIGRTLTAVGTSTDDGSRIWLHRHGAAEAVAVYEHPEDAGVGALSEDETLLAISHSEHGDSRHPAVRVLRTTDGSTLAEKSDGPGRGLVPVAFAPVAGDPRLLLLHERRGREELMLWDVVADREIELAIELPGDLFADFYPDAAALLVWHTHAARTRLHRYDLTTGGLTELDTAPGCIGSARVRPGGTVEYTCSSAARPPSIRALHPDGGDRELLVPPGEPAPESVPVEDAWVNGAGGPIHVLIARPAGEGPHPAVFSLHGGPHAADEDRFSPTRAAWVDAGFAVVEINYRGSTGYGSPWRDAIEGRPGLTELEDVAVVHDWAVAIGLADPEQTVVEGWSWGGFLALLAAGTQPARWAAAIAGVPVADYLAAYADEMEQLRAFDRALFGGSPEQVPETYRTASPLTYVADVRAPILVLAGENDPRCPIRQIDNYLDALAALPEPVHYEVSRFDAGHGSLVVEQTLRHVATEIDFARRVVG
ncbi:S9 family peptidase [Pseudonocardia asaccharolytica]|uniref:Peptide hydrolase n=1 Tax=Pseudonocardia asaccharolytica DSM 44247 = NBRC 16224 TaxID=1123024 RepID=A0A511D3U7_9PSEU|nr:prolyl oligopeptidase family serine peptidase [Pseudonocardia asaccharolytica]GEL19183.1 peptide hydrolase [Pseudonocardia asaccharolytica DSM 44247 = NBRC 16224]